MITTTYQNFEKVIADCKHAVQSAPADPPDGYDAGNEELTQVADECWYSGMDQLGNALLNWAHDQPDALAQLRRDARVCQAHFERVMAGDSYRRLNSGDRAILGKIHEWIRSLNIQNGRDQRPATDDSKQP